ncbi:uncharacterized protein LOC108491420 [Nannospalax galili]|uniref:uncharacterized protein LOC108491420 n=1 Tax=Nannospalax galili TaxID=1026970 RepID=UPI00111C6393|nr:uncharacterized protein LOC108491420 [Nannospalax galili]
MERIQGSSWGERRGGGGERAWRGTTGSEQASLRGRWAGWVRPRECSQNPRPRTGGARSLQSHPGPRQPRWPGPAPPPRAALLFCRCPSLLRTAGREARGTAGPEPSGTQDPGPGTRDVSGGLGAVRFSPSPAARSASRRDVTGHPPAPRSAGQSACGRRAHGPAGGAGSGGWDLEEPRARMGPGIPRAPRVWISTWKMLAVRVTWEIWLDPQCITPDSPQSVSGWSFLELERRPDLFDMTMIKDAPLEGCACWLHGNYSGIFRALWIYSALGVMLVDAGLGTTLSMLRDAASGFMDSFSLDTHWGQRPQFQVYFSTFDLVGIFALVSLATWIPSKTVTTGDKHLPMPCLY